MLELLIVLSIAGIALAALSGIGFLALFAAGASVMLAVIFADWLRHKWLPLRTWTERRFGAELRALEQMRASLLLWAGLGAFLGVLGYLWAARLGHA